MYGVDVPVAFEKEVIRWLKNTKQHPTPPLEKVQY